MGIAGSDEKCALVPGTYRFSACLTYKQPGFAEALRAAAGEGFDVYHDNVGGPMLVDALKVLRNYGTVVLCGMMAEYNTAPEERSFCFPMALPVLKRAVLKGLVEAFVADTEQGEPAASPFTAQSSISRR